MNCVLFVDKSSLLLLLTFLQRVSVASYAERCTN